MAHDSHGPPEVKPFALTVAYDVGTSGGKVLASYESGQYPFPLEEGYFLIPPAMRVLTQESYETLLDEFAQRRVGIGSSLVAYTDPFSGERAFWEVGETATRPGLLAVGDRKFEKCLAKVLSFLGYAVLQLMRTDGPVLLRLGVLLPFDEIGDRKLLADSLRQSVSDFEFNGHPIRNIELESIDVKPEGYGIFRATDAQRVLIVGHSDSSWLCYSDGMLNTKLSRTLPETGMHDFIREIDFPVAYELRTAQAIAQSGTKLQTKPLLELTQTRTEAEVERLRGAISMAKAQYWSDRRSQFASLNIGGVSEIPVSGGTAFCFASELNELFRGLFGVRLNWCRDLMREFVERFEADKGVDLSHRFADCYGYFRALPGVPRYEAKSVEVMGGAING